MITGGRAVALATAALVITSCGTSPQSHSASSHSVHPTSTVQPVQPSTAPGDRSRSSSSVTYGLDLDPANPAIGLSRVPQVLQMIHQAGATTVRTGGNWPTEEPSPGHYNFSEVDELLSLARTDGLTVLFELGREPAWDAVGGNINAPPADCDSPTATCASVTQYVRALVEHAAPEGLHYLIVRNEPQDFDKNWVGGDAATYAHFQQVVYQAAHAQDPAIQVLNGGTEATTPTLLDHLGPQATLESKAIAFANALYANPSWCVSLDVLDLHVGDFGPVWSPEIVDASERALQVCNGGRHVPVWVTEVGYPSTPALQAAPVLAKELDGKYQGGEVGQARFLTETFSALVRDPNVIGINWTFTVDPNTSQTPPIGASRSFDDGFGDGLFYSSFHPKASYQAYRLIAANHPSPEASHTRH
jgi:hypothetical protein